MPQRVKTPPPPQDEIFMTIFYPYPQHANMEVEEDVEHVAQWLGSIVKPEYFNAFYHKPSARNTVIIEVSKAIGDDKRKLLGQHIWKEILSSPSEGEKRHRSGIFYCIFNNVRDVQKEGWKRIDFEETWFMPREGRKHTSYDQAVWEDIVKKDGVFRMPYPLSSRCEVPMEDPTNRGFCRPLPVDLFPIPVLPEMPKEIPGTLAWTKIKSLPEGAWAKQPSKKRKAGSQAAPQPNERSAAPRNSNVGPPVLPNSSGVDHKSPGTLPPNLVKGKGKEKATDTSSIDVDELVAHTIAMELEGEEEDREYQEYYGAGLENVLASAGIATSPALPSPDRDPIDRAGVGVHVSGVSIKPIVIKNSLWGDPLEKDKNKNKNKEKKEEVLLCEYHGKVCSRGICKVYEKQLRDQKKLKESQEPKIRRSGTDSPNDGRGGRGGRGLGRGTRGMLLLRGSAPGRDFGPRSPRDGAPVVQFVPGDPPEPFSLTENEAPRKANGVTPPKIAWSKPSDNPKGNAAWGAKNNGWSPSEKGESAKPVGNSKGNAAWGANNDGWSPSEKGEPAKPAGNPNPNPGEKDDTGDDAGPSNPPGGRDWSQSEIGGGSQADPWSGPGQAGHKPNGKPGWNEIRNPNPAGRGTPLKSPVKPAWEGQQNWTPSELGLNDSVSQRGDGFRNVPSLEPGKKSWADLAEDGDEMDYGSGDEPAPTIAPAPDLGGDGDGDEDEWVESGKGKKKGKGRGKAKSATGWSDVTNQGPW